MKLIELKQAVVDKINELGPEAPNFFGKNKATITNWLKDPSKIPLSAIEPIIDASEEFEDNRETTQAVAQGLTEQDERKYEGFISPAGIKQIHDAIDEAFTEIRSVQSRLNVVEQYAVPQYQPQPQAQTISTQGAIQNAPATHPGMTRPTGQILEVNPNEQNAGSMVRPGRETEMRVVPPRNPLQTGIAPTAQEADPTPQPAPVQPTAMPPTIPQGRSWLDSHQPRRR